MTEREFKRCVRGLCSGRPQLSFQRLAFGGRIIWRLKVSYPQTYVFLSHTNPGVLLTELKNQLSKRGKLKCTESTRR